MILYVNGCSHTAAAEAAVSYGWAVDDGQYWRRGKEPHPANLAVSYGRHVADALGAELVCDASAGGSNDRIIRTTKSWIENNPDKLKDTFMILQWTTWEREEWLYQGTWYQVNASGIDIVPDELQERYKNYVVNVDWLVPQHDCCPCHPHNVLFLMFHQPKEHLTILYLLQLIHVLDLLVQDNNHLPMFDLNLH
jgi:hypothetical protein